MMASISLSKALLNLFIGLCKQSPALRPHSENFSNLGYKPWAIEQRIKLETGREVCPELILSSSWERNSLVFEWTESSYPNSKDDQFHRYASVTADDLMNGAAAVPAAAAEKHDITLVVLEEHLSNFAAFLEDQAHGFPLLGCAMNGVGLALSKNGVSFSTDETEQFFGQGLSFQRVPTGYMDFSPERISETEIAATVATHVYERFTRGNEAFTVHDFCPTCFNEWAIFGVEKQKELKVMTRRVLLQLGRFEVGGIKIVQRIQRSPSKWRVGNAGDYQARQLQSIRKQLLTFPEYVSLEQKRGQRDLFDQNDEPEED